MLFRVLILSIAVIFATSNDYEARSSEIAATFGDWSVVCDNDGCFITSPYSYGFWLTTLLVGPGNYQTSIQTDGSQFPTDKLALHAGSTTANLIIYNEPEFSVAYLDGDLSQELEVVAALRAASTASVDWGTSSREVSLRGYTKALEAAHLQSGMAYDPSIFSGNTRSLAGDDGSTGDAETIPSQSSGSTAGASANVSSACTDSEIERQISEITRRGESRMAGAGMKQALEISAEVLGEAIRVYEGAQHECGRDFSDIIAQLRANRDAALRNASQM